MASEQEQGATPGAAHAAALRILGLSPDAATPAEVRAAFKHLEVKW